MRGNFVPAHANDLRPCFAELFHELLKLLRMLDAPPREVTGIEIDDERSLARSACRFPDIPFFIQSLQSRQVLAYGRAVGFGSRIGLGIVGECTFDMSHKKAQKKR